MPNEFDKLCHPGKLINVNSNRILFTDDLGEEVRWLTYLEILHNLFPKRLLVLCIASFHSVIIHTSCTIKLIIMAGIG